MKLRFSSFILLCALLSNTVSGQDLVLTPFATEYDEPVGVENMGDERLFVIEQKGVIQMLDTAGEKKSNPFLNIEDKVNDRGNEQGLLGLAFHPEYRSNGLLYVNYTIGSRATVIAEYKVSNDKDVVDVNSERILMTIAQPYSNHNGGCIEFGPDGYLYIGMGDGGFAGDPKNAGQTPAEQLGKMLRIDVNQGEPYGIPSDNPFIDKEEYAAEIWAMGLRNPWRFEFDPFNGDLWIADVGQDKWEEISFQPGSSSGGENYGWRCRESAHDYRPGDCDENTVLTDPVFEFANNKTFGCSVTGGHVYRGALHSDLFGKYLFTDYCSGNIWVTTKNNNDFQTELLGQFVQNNYSSFAYDMSGETYLCERATGRIMKVSTKGNCKPVAHFKGFEEETVWTVGSPLEAGKANGLSYKWLLDGKELNETSNKLIPEATGTYTCIVTNLRNCSDTINLDITALITSQQEITKLTKAQIFPNPANERLTVKIPSDWPQLDEISILDVSGKTTQLRKKIGPNQEIINLHIATLSKGAHLIQFKAKGWIWTQSFSVNR